jgi:hypothetical protein
MSLVIDAGGGTSRSPTYNGSDAIKRLAETDQTGDAASRQTPSRTAKRAASAKDAVADIQTRPVPRSADLTGMSGAVGAAIYTSRVQAFNDQRRDDARQALLDLAPQRSDFTGTNPATADAEYRDAQSQFNADPYVQELNRIQVEATTKRDSVPSYLIDAQATVNTAGMTVPDMRGPLAALGVNLPENPTPAQIDAGLQLLGSVPQSLIGTIVNPGMQVSFESPVAGLGTTSFLPVGANASAVAQGEVSLSEPQVGIGFSTTQRFDMSVELRGELSGGTQTSTQRRIYTWARRIEGLVSGSDEIKKMVESSPLLRNAVRSLPVSLTYDSFAGTRLSYSAVVTPEQGTRIDNGDLTAAPNPLNPLAMPEGTSVLIVGQDLEGSNFEMGYKLMRVGTNFAELEGLGFGVRRGEGSMVEVYSGPVSTVENELFLGLGRGSVQAGVTATHSYESQQMAVAHIDLSTEEGQAAYQQFITSGQVPSWNPPGVTRRGEQDIFEYEHTLGAGVELGPLSVNVGGVDAQDSIVETTWQDGTKEQTSTSMLHGVTSEVSFSRDAAGNPVLDQATWRLMVPNSHPALASYVNAAYHVDELNREFDGEQHVQYTYTTAELMALRDMSREYVQTAFGDYGQDRLDNLKDNDMSAGISEVETALALAETPEEVFEALTSRAGFVPEDLLAISLQMGGPVPGEIEFRDAGN